MKKRLSTKVLAIFMAVLMLVTAVPFSALAAGTYNDDSGNISTLVTAIKNYESAMANGDILANMAKAYDAYLNALKAYDAYYYGGGKVTAVAANQYGTTLQDEVDVKAQRLTNITAGNYIPFEDNTAPADVEKLKANSNKVLWGETVKPGEGGVELHVDSGNYIASNHSETRAMVSYGNTVLLYDGNNGDNNRNSPRFPIMARVWYTAGGPSGYNNDDRIYYLIPTSSNYIMNLNDYSRWDDGDRQWRGGIVGNKSYSAQLANDGNMCAYQNTSTGTYFDVSSSNKYLSSTVQCLGNPNADLSVSYETISFQLWASPTPLLGQHPNGTDTREQPWNIYYVNYKKVSDVINSIQNGQIDDKFGFLRNINQYTEDTDVEKFMQAVDAAYKFNPSNKQPSVNPEPMYRDDYNYDVDFTATKNQISADIDFIVQNVNVETTNANIQSNAAISTAVDSYPELRTAIKNAEAKLAEGYKADNVTRNSEWANFEARLNLAHSWFADGAGQTNLWKAYGTLATDLAAATAKLNFKADFSAYNEGKKNLTDGKFSAKDLNELVLDAALYAKTEEEQQNVTIDSQSDIDKDAALMNALEPVNTKVYDARLAALKAEIAGADNTDKYNMPMLNEALDNAQNPANYTEEVTLNIGKLTGYNYDALAEALLTAINTSQYNYTVTIDNDVKGESFHYGDEIVLPANTNGYLVEVKADETDKTITSRAKGGDTLVVRGNMVVTSCDAPASETTTFVKFLSSVTGKVMYVDSYDIGTTVNFADVQSKLTAPAFYEFKGFTVNGQACDSVVAEGGEIIVWVQFKAVENPGVYSVTIGGTKLPDKQYNAQVTAKIDGAYGYKDKETGTVLWIGDTYKFSVSENIEIVAMTEEEAEAAKSNIASYAVSAPIYSNGTTTITGSYSNADVKVVSQGIIIDKKNKFAGGEYTLADVSNAQSVANYSITNVDSANQYALLLRGQSGVAYSYRTYVTYEYEYKDGEDTKKATKTVYSAVREAQPPQA